MTETRALLLTDVVDSTKLSEALGDAAMAELWAKHDRVARDLLPVHHGREIDKTDGFLMLFEEASDAVAYAVAYHQALRELDIAARAGLHVGEVILTENDPEDVARGAKPLEVDGIAKPTAARVMSVATGGQTLLTPSAVEALGDTELRVESHGHWRMKGVAEPLELFEVGDDDAPFQPPPDGGKVYRVVERDGLWLPVREVKHSLPAERDAFVGRSADLQTLHRLLGESRLVSVLGIGGTGKTRLVTRFGWTWLGDYPGGVWFCDLADARDAHGVDTAVARGLGVRIDAGGALAEKIAAKGRCLVVLDNFEQVASHATGTLGAWLDRSPEARFVVTTREVLGLPGEQVVALAPLDAEEAIEMFERRARAAGRDVSGDPVLSTLVDLLDRLPLAIELAAARSRTMAPETLLLRIDQRFRLLASRGRRTDRQATLRATLDWSWDLLETSDRRALAQLSVFRGAFPLDAAVAVLELPGDAWPEDAVQALVDKCLLDAVEGGFRMLTTVWEYARLRARELGVVESSQVRHAAWFADLTRGSWLSEVDEHGGEHYAAWTADFASAARFAIARGDSETAGWTAIGLAYLAALVGPYDEAIGVLEHTLELSHADVGLVARLAHQLGKLLRRQGRLDEARGPYERALRLEQQLGRRVRLGVAHNHLGLLEESLGRTDRAIEHFEAARRLYRACGERSLTLGATTNLVRLLRGRGELDRARELLLDAGTEAAAVGRRAWAGNRLLVGLLERDSGRMDAALAHVGEALEACRAAGDRPGHVAALRTLAHTLDAIGESERAVEHIETARTLSRSLSPLRQVAVLGSVGLLCLRTRPGRAREALEQALAMTVGAAATVERGWTLEALGELEEELGDLDAARARYGEALEVARELEDPRMEGLVCCRLARVHGDPTEALRLAERAVELLRSYGLQFRVEAQIAQARALAASDVEAARAALDRASEMATPGLVHIERRLADASRRVDEASRADPS